MVRWVKRLGYGLGALVALACLLVAGVYGFSTVRLGRSHALPPVEALTIPSHAAALARGEHLVKAVTKCGDCHGADMGGRLFIDGGAMIGRVYAPNVTRGRGSVTADFSAGDWERALRHGLAPDGRALKIMPSNEFAALSDADLGAIVAYVRSLPPVERTIPQTRVGPISRALYLAGQFPILPAEAMDQRARHQATVTPAVSAEYGKYLAEAGGCTGCHGPGLSGGHVPGTPPDFPAAQNLTRTGIGSWSEGDFFKALRTGHRPDGTLINTFMPWQSAGLMTDDEIRAVWLYLRSVPPRQTGTR
ncbi:MAG TPA: cytochrome c [Longimicrobiales bacterium]